MKYYGTRTTALGLAVAMAAVLGASSLKAEEAKSSGGKSKVEMCCMDGEKKDRHGGDWKKKLDLTDDQAKKFDSIKKSLKAEIKPSREKLESLTKKLKGQVEAKASDADIKASLDELSSTRTSLRSAMEKYHGQLKEVLTPTQQAKWLVCRMDRRHHWMHHGEEHEDHDGEND